MILTKYFKSIFICNLVNLWLFDNQYNFFNNLMYVINWAPFFVQNFHLNRSIYWNVWMKHFCEKANGRSFVRVILSEFKHQLESAAFPRGLIRTKYDSLPSLMKNERLDANISISKERNIPRYCPPSGHR